MITPILHKPLWRETPLVESRYLAEQLGCEVFLKLELHQPSGSFKSRGIGNYVLNALRSYHESYYTSTSNSCSSSTSASFPSSNANANSEHVHALPPPPHFYSSSGGNAGLACVVAAHTLGCPCTVVVPTSTPIIVHHKLIAAGAVEVIAYGNNWTEADAYLRGTVMVEAKDKHNSTSCSSSPKSYSCCIGGDESSGNIYVPPFDHEDIWKGNATLMEEVARQLPVEMGIGDGATCPAPTAIVCSVGGGGLFCGLMQGVDELKWDKTHMIVVETAGADSLAQAYECGQHIKLDKITSQAATLGAVKVANQTWQYANSRRDLVHPVVVADRQAATACVRMAENERILTEMACGAAYAAMQKHYVEKSLGRDLTGDDVIVLIVCGGSAVTLDMLDQWRKDSDNE